MQVTFQKSLVDDLKPFWTRADIREPQTTCRSTESRVRFVLSAFHRRTMQTNNTMIKSLIRMISQIPKK